MGAPRLLVIVRGSESHGIATKLTSLIRSYAARGWAVTAMVLGGGAYLDGLRAEAIEIVEDPVAPRLYEVARYGRVRSAIAVARSSAGFVRRLRALLRRERFDAAIFAEHGLVLPVAAAVAGMRTPTFWLMPNVVSGAYPLDLNRRLYAAAFAASGMVAVANSAFTKRTLGRAARHAHAMELGVDTRALAMLPLPVPREGAVRLALVARLEPEKGQLALVRALLGDATLGDLALDIHGGPLGTPYAAAIAEAAAGAGGRVVLAGPTGDIPAVYAAADAGVSVRLNEEPFGLSIVEAMAAGRPVLAHGLGGPADIVVDGVTGWLIDDVSPAGLAAGLRRMLADRARWPAMGAAARDRALARYTVEAMTDRLMAIMAVSGVAAAAPGPATSAGGGGPARAGR